jgi:ribosomal protein L7Ae-like RNA K-turn-binding protein
MNSEEKFYRIINLMQFARKAGKMVSGTDACLRDLRKNNLKLIIITDDTSTKTVKRITEARNILESSVPIVRLGTQKELSKALGTPISGIFGIKDGQFAAKMLEYYSN